MKMEFLHSLLRKILLGKRFGNFDVKITLPNNYVVAASGTLQNEEELGKLIGVQKSQISRLENNASNATVDTLMRVFTALQAIVKLQVELSTLNISIGQ